jgi:hypothetical protein
MLCAGRVPGRPPGRLPLSVRNRPADPCLHVGRRLTCYVWQLYGSTVQVNPWKHYEKHSRRPSAKM